MAGLLNVKTILTIMALFFMVSSFGQKKEEIKQLNFIKTQKQLKHQHERTNAMLAEMILPYKNKGLIERQQAKQKLLQNGMHSGAFLVSLIALFLFFKFLGVKNRETQQAILTERKRISADLHDDIGSGLSRISLLSELLKKEANTQGVRNEIEKITTISRELSSNINEIIWTLNSNNDYLENLLAYIRRYAAEYFENSSVKLKITTPANIAHTPINSECRRNIFYSVKEALHNIIKHSQATEASLRYTLNNNVLCVIIIDNGNGMPEGELNRFGNGVNNMRNRMKSIKGEFSIENNQGTIIKLTLPV